MHADFMIVLGSLSILAAAPALLNGYSRGEGPGVWGVLMIAGFGLITAALATNPTGYSYDTLPRAFGHVFSQLVN